MAQRFRVVSPRRQVSVFFSPAERRRLYEAATLNQQTVSAFVREAAAEAMADCLEDDEGRETPPRGHERT